jgi:hypothetical protein
MFEMEITMRKDLVAMLLHVQEVLEELKDALMDDCSLGTCPKCHSCDLTVEYHSADNECNCDWDVEEHLKYDCRCCGYTWAESTKDG